MSFSATEKKYQLPDGSFTTDFFVWHNSNVRDSQNKVKLTSAIANDKFEQSGQLKGESLEHRSSQDVLQQYQLSNGSFTTNFLIYLNDSCTRGVTGINKNEETSPNRFNSRAFLEEDSRKQYQLSDGSFTSSFLVYHDDQANNECGVMRRFIKSEMENFSTFVSDLCWKRNQSLLAKTAGDHYQARELMRDKELDTSYLAEKTYYLFGVTFGFISYGERECYEDYSVDQYHRIAKRFTEEMLTLNGYNPEDPAQVVEFLKKYREQYPALHPKSLGRTSVGNIIYFPRSHTP
jgi:hypothetical protein